MALDSINASICDQPIEIKFEVSSGEGALKPLLRLIDSTDGICLCMSDDAKVAPDAIQNLYNAYIESFPNMDGLCFPSDGLGDKDINGFFFAHSKTLQENIHRKYFHNFADRDLFEVMKRKKKFRFVGNALISHLHYSRDLSLDDATYKLAEENSSRDGDIFQERSQNNFGVHES